MRCLVGLIPAAGVGSRLGSQSSKELAPIADLGGESGQWRPVVSSLLDAMGAAGIETAYVVLRRGKWDIPDQLAKRGDTPPRIGYVVTNRTKSIPETLDRARPFVRSCDVLLGFPDVVFHPTTAACEVLAARRRTGADVVLALFPSERPDQTDMVEVRGEWVTGFRVKPGRCELEYTWLLGAWGESFTEFLGSYLDRTEGVPPPGSSLAELQMSQVLEAALGGGLTIGACTFPEGRFIDIGTPEDLARAQEGDGWPRA